MTGESFAAFVGYGTGYHIDTQLTRERLRIDLSPQIAVRKVESERRRSYERLGNLIWVRCGSEEIDE